jgi:hypothetical protein
MIQPAAPHLVEAAAVLVPRALELADVRRLLAVQKLPLCSAAGCV